MASGPNSDPIIPIPKSAGMVPKKNWIRKLAITRQKQLHSHRNQRQKKKKKACLERGPPWCHRVLNERKELQAPPLVF